MARGRSRRRGELMSYGRCRFSPCQILYLIVQHIISAGLHAESCLPVMDFSRLLLPPNANHHQRAAFPPVPSSSFFFLIPSLIRHPQPRHTQPRHPQPRRSQPRHTQPRHPQPRRSQPRHKQPRHHLGTDRTEIGKLFKRNYFVGRFRGKKFEDYM